MRDPACQLATGTPQRSRRGLVASAILIAGWAIVLFAVQEYTTGSNYPLSPIRAVGSRVVRLLLDLLACGTAAFLLKGWLLYAALIGCTLTLSVLVVYYEYFGHVLTWTTITNHFGEGLAVGDYAMHLLHWQSFSLIVSAAVILLILARRMNRNPPPRRQRVTIAAFCTAGYLFVAVVSTQYIDRIEKLKTFATVDRLAMTNGYLLTWYGEWRHLDADALLGRAMEAARIKQDRLTPLETPLSLGDQLAIVQVESLDYDVVGFEIEGRAVMPFLRDLSRSSMLYRIRAIHKSGSCDSDFAMLMNIHPAGDVAPYIVPGFDWSPSIAALAARGGYRSVFFHGNDRSFFNRGTGVDKMGFKKVLFREDLESRYGLTSKHWGVCDKDVFAVSSSLLNEDAGRALHFIITLTSHGPYHFLDPEDYELFPNPTTQREHYLNSMRYLDTQLRTYIGSLPDAAVVVLYGDHTSHVAYGQGPFTRGREYVPLLIHQVGADLAPLQRTRAHKISTSGELTTLDAAGYVWSLLRNTMGK